MIEKHAPAERRRRVDVGLEHFRRSALQVERELPPAVPPKPMGEAMRLNRMKTLEMQEGLEEPDAGRIAFDDGREIGAEGRDQRGFGGDRSRIGVGDRLGGDDRGAEPRRDPPHDRLAEAVAMSTAPVKNPRAPARAPSRLWPRPANGATARRPGADFA